MPHTEALQHQDPCVAKRIYAVFEVARAQELKLLGHEPHLRGNEWSPERIQSSKEFYLGAFVDGVLAGVVGIGPDDEPNQLCIRFLVVHPDVQRRGVGASLVSAALNRGKGMVFSVVAVAKNAPALLLYQALGFVQYRQGTMGPGEQAMVKLRKAA